MKGPFRNRSKKINQTAKFKTTFPGVALILLVLFLFGCSSGKRSAKAPRIGKYYAVTSEKAAFYKYGPQQGSGADLQLPKDTLLTLVRASFGYCKVTLSSGEQGYVAREDINVAPPNLVAAVTNPAGNLPHGEQFNINSNDPRLVAPPEPLPDTGPTMPVEPDSLPQQPPQ
jgi:hypothetical protein